MEIAMDYGPKILKHHREFVAILDSQMDIKRYARSWIGICTADQLVSCCPA